MISFGYARVSTPGPGFERTGRGVAKLRLVSFDDTPLILDPKFFVRELSDVHRDQSGGCDAPSGSTPGGARILPVSVCALLSRRTTRAVALFLRRGSNRHGRIRKTALRKTAR